MIKTMITKGYNSFNGECSTSTAANRSPKSLIRAIVICNFGEIFNHAETFIVTTNFSFPQRNYLNRPKNRKF